MSITARADIELVTQVLEDDPVPEYLQRQTAVVERLGMEIDSTRQRLEATCRQLEQLTERMSGKRVCWFCCVGGRAARRNSSIARHVGVPQQITHRLTRADSNGLSWTPRAGQTSEPRTARDDCGLIFTAEVTRPTSSASGRSGSMSNPCAANRVRSSGAIRDLPVGA